MVLKFDGSYLYLEKLEYLVGEKLNVIFKTDGDLSEYKTYIKINKLPTKEFEESFEIPESELKKSSLTFKLRLDHRKENISKNFTSDPIPIRRYFAIGESFDIKFPESIKVMEEKYQLLESKYKTLANAVLELGKKGEIL